MTESTQRVISAFSPGSAPTDWWRFVVATMATMTLLALAAMAAIIIVDPYGVRVKPGGTPRPLMDINQRFMYPQIIRAGSYDAVVLGTSSVRLLDPQRLNGVMGGARFINLGMNAGTPWEQAQVAALVAREGAVPGHVIWGLDTTWCEVDATSAAKRLTPRPFPDWLYDRAEPSDYRHMFNTVTAEIVVRTIGVRFGWQKPRMRADGFDEFTPPDATYDAARALFHLYRNQPVTAQQVRAGGGLPLVAMPDHARYPALEWLEEWLSALPQKTRIMLVLPPLHAASMPGQGVAERDDAGCKASIGAIARKVGAGLIDYRVASNLAVSDGNFWDPMHYRIGIAEQIAMDIAALFKGRLPDDLATRAGGVALPAR